MLGDVPMMAFVATAKPDQARQFYGATLGLTLVSDDDYAVVFTANGTMLRIQKLPKHEPAQFTVLGWEVTDLVTMVLGLVERGVSFERFSFMPQDEHGIWTAPSGARVAWFKDPDGNTLSLTQL